MKKVIFSAIAMIAFVGSSMASDIAEKEVAAIIEKEAEIKTTAIDFNTCLLVAIKQVMFYQENGASFEDSISLADAFFVDCIRR